VIVELILCYFINVIYLFNLFNLFNFVLFY
jgi:hypothetical protein